MTETEKTVPAAANVSPAQGAIVAKPKIFPHRLCEVLEREFVTVHGPLVKADARSGRGENGGAEVTSGWKLRSDDISFEELRKILKDPSRSPVPGAIVSIRKKLRDLDDGGPALEKLSEEARKKISTAVVNFIQGTNELDDKEKSSANAGQRVLPISGDSHGSVAPQADLDEEDSRKLRDEIVSRMNRLLSSNEMLFDHHYLNCDSETWELACLWIDARGQMPEETEQLNRMLLEAAVPAEAIARADDVRLSELFCSIDDLKQQGKVRSAICLSGGGIRSAAFGLGVLGSFARYGVLQNFDFLSTVSGGGYVGSWLSTWIHRHPGGLEGVVSTLGKSSKTEAGKIEPHTEPAPEPVNFLRSYSHFLNPKSGFFSADTWSWSSIYLRNLILNWLVMIPFLLIILALPRYYASLVFEWKPGREDLFPSVFYVASVAILSVLVCMTLNRPSLTDVASDAASKVRPLPSTLLQRFRRPGWVLGLGVVPLFAFGVLLTLLVWQLPATKSAIEWVQVAKWLPRIGLADYAKVLAHIVFDHFLVWGEFLILISWAITRLFVPKRDIRRHVLELGSMLLAGSLMWLILSELASLGTGLTAKDGALFHIGSSAVYPEHMFTILAVPVVVAVVMLGMTIFIGMVSKFKWIEDEDREWWATFGAWVFMGTIGWIVLTAIAVLGPPLLQDAPNLIAALGGVSGLAAILIGKSSLTAATNGDQGNVSQWKKISSSLGINALSMVSFVFLIIFFMLLSLLTSVLFNAALGWLNSAPNPYDGLVPNFARYWFDYPSFVLHQSCGEGAPLPWRDGVFNDPQRHLQLFCQTPSSFIWRAILIAYCVLLGAGLLINLNKFSLHAAYRIRIVRTFLGASRGIERKPNLLTGFDPFDNIQMHELQPGLVREGDIVDLRSLVEELKQALSVVAQGGANRRPCRPAMRILAMVITHRDIDPSGILRSHLGMATPEKEVLRSLQRLLVERINSALEAADFVKQFRDCVDAETVERAVSHSKNKNRIFANRVILQAVFGQEFGEFKFPPPPPHKLLHVINLTLNVVHGNRLAWQERKAAPFVVTPMHSGSYYLGFRSSREYGGMEGVSIGTAVAVSGAAVSPNMGYSSSALTALVLTLFNVRLGWWLGNPGVAGTLSYRRSEPKFSITPLILEGLGLTNDKSKYVYLSDGGHFDNLGLFEMVLRRCRLIVVTDAGADPAYDFGDLGNAVRKIRIDLGIEIEFDRMPIKRMNKNKSDDADKGNTYHEKGSDYGADESGKYCMIGRIRYSTIDGEAASDGLLIVFKPVLLGREPADVQNYGATHQAFPQEPTLNQFYGESQFESYRRLGDFAVQTVIGGKPESNTSPWGVRFVKFVQSYLDGQKAESSWVGKWIEDHDQPAAKRT